eukprot:COSAG05_NODE_130_length_17165_cov_154.623638_7_plen_99_part_00
MWPRYEEGTSDSINDALTTPHHRYHHYPLEGQWRRPAHALEAPEIAPFSLRRFVHTFEVWDLRVVQEFVRGFLSAKEFRESYGVNPLGGSETSLYQSR